MSITRWVLALSTFAALGSCGDDPMKVPDAPPADAPPDAMPAAPTLGMQLDRAGRPVISTALIGLRDAPEVAAMKRDAYGAATDPSAWASAPIASGRSILAELVGNLAILDVLDKGNNAIPGAGATAPGCKNQLLYNDTPDGGGIPGSTSYDSLATLLADDMLYVDTAKATCSSYLELEIEFVRAGAIAHTGCGGRAPTYDVIDGSYSALLAGLAGFTAPPAMLPRITDGVTAHADLSNTAFPYFGAPH